MTWHRVDSEQPTPFESAFAGARNGRSRVRSRPQYAKMTFQIGSGWATRIAVSYTHLTLPTKRIV